VVDGDRTAVGVEGFTKPPILGGRMVGGIGGALPNKLVITSGGRMW
jgi:hypothetical protein